MCHGRASSSAPWRSIARGRLAMAADETASLRRTLTYAEQAGEWALLCLGSLALASEAAYGS
ncbi:unnamed protein product [Urochloa humidicola]